MYYLSDSIHCGVCIVCLYVLIISLELKIVVIFETPIMSENK